MASKVSMMLKMFSEPSKSFDNPSIFVYGAPGSGKTYFAGSLAETHNTIIVAAENGVMTIRDKAVKVIDADPLGDGIVQGTNDVMAMIESILATPSRDGRPYAVVVDTLTSAQSKLEHELQEKRYPKPLQQQDWGLITAWTERFLHRVAQLKATSVMLCHAKEDKDSESGAVLIRPSLRGSKLPLTCTAEYDFAVFAGRFPSPEHDGSIRYGMLTRYHSDKYTVKDRSGLLPAIVPNDWARWQEYLSGSHFDHVEGDEDATE